MVDTAKDILTSALRSVEPRPDGKVLRVVFLDRQQQEVAFQIPTSAVATLLPFLARAAAEAKRLSGDEAGKIVFPIETAEIGLTEQGAVVFDFHLPEGASFVFQLEKDFASVLLGQLARLLGSQPDAGPIAPAARH